MTKNNTRKAEKELLQLKRETTEKIWQYMILKEFIILFSQNNNVLNFIYPNFYAEKIGLVDDRIPITKKQLALYERGKEPSLKESLYQLLDITI